MTKNNLTTFISILCITLSILVFSGCGNAAQSNNLNATVNTAPTVSSNVLTEVSKHNQPSDCWTIIEGTTYNITDYVLSGQHNPSIERACGVDSTSMFLAKHRGGKQTTARDILKNLPIIKL